MRAAQQSSLAVGLPSSGGVPSFRGKEPISPRLTTAGCSSMGRRKSLEDRREFAFPRLPKTQWSTGGLGITGSEPPSEVRPEGGQRRNSFERPLPHQCLSDRKPHTAQGWPRRSSLSFMQLFAQSGTGDAMDVEPLSPPAPREFNSEPPSLQVPREGTSEPLPPSLQAPRAGKSARGCLAQRSSVTVARASAILSGGHEPRSSSSGAAVGFWDGADAAGASSSDAFTATASSRPSALKNSSSSREELTASNSSQVTGGQLCTNMSTSLDAKGGSCGGQDDSGKHDCARDELSKDLQIQESRSSPADSLTHEAQVDRDCGHAAAREVQTLHKHVCSQTLGSHAQGDALTVYFDGGSAYSTPSGELASGAPWAGVQSGPGVGDQTVDAEKVFSADRNPDASPRDLAGCWQEVRPGREGERGGGPTKQGHRKEAAGGSGGPRAARPRRVSLTKRKTAWADGSLLAPSDEVETGDDISDERVDGFIEEMFSQYCTAKDKRSMPLMNGAGVRSFFIDFTGVEGGKLVALADVIYAEELERQIDLNFVFELSKADAARGLCFKAFQCMLDQVIPRGTSRRIARSHFHTYAGSAANMLAPSHTYAGG